MDGDSVPYDDVLDTTEISEKLSKYMNRTLKDHEVKIAMSALIQSTINCIASQCEDVEDLIFYREVVHTSFNMLLRKIRIRPR